MPFTSSHYLSLPYAALLFPSTLSHSVDENFSNDTRYSLAFNAFVKGQFGKDEYKLTL